MSATWPKWAQLGQSGRKLAKVGATTPKRVQLIKSAHLQQSERNYAKVVATGKSGRNLAKVGATSPKCAQLKDQGNKQKKTKRAQMSKRWAQPSQSWRSNSARRRNFATVSATKQKLAQLCQSGRDEAKVGAAWPKWVRQYQSGGNRANVNET